MAGFHGFPPAAMAFATVSSTCCLLSADVLVDDHACGRVVGELLVELEPELREEALGRVQVLDRQVYEDHSHGVSSPGLMADGCSSGN